jgi:hypothetical protein
VEYGRYISQFLPSHLIFVDESACDRRTTYRGRAWAIKGHRATRKAFFVRGKRFVIIWPHICEIDACINSRYLILPALSLDGIIHCDIVEGSFNSDKFITFIKVLVNSRATNAYPDVNSVIVMDNCAIHKHPEVRELIEDA